MNSQSILKALLTPVLLTFLFGSVSLAYQAGINRIVIFSSGDPGRDPSHPLIVGFRDGLREMGYVEGKNLALSIPSIKSIDQLKTIMHGYDQDTIDVFITIGVTESAIAKKVISKTPIIFMPAVDPQQAGLVESLAHPGTNLTGLAYDQGFEMRGKQLEIFKEIDPTLRRLLVLYDANLESPLHFKSLRLLERIALYLGLTLIDRPVKSYLGAEEAVLSLAAERGNGVFILCSNFFSGDESTPVIAKNKQLPLHGCPTQVIKYGALVSYSPNFYYIGRRGAWYADQIINGTKPQNLPVETPNKYELIINRKTANAIGLQIRPEVLQKADRVIR
jgi:ABC-type uncharacterized transport system substrate-binding protein